MEEGRSKGGGKSSSSSSTSQKGARRGGGSISSTSSSPGKKFFRCTTCSYVTNVKARFTKHVKYHSMPLIKCDFCDFKSPYKWNLDRHLKNHGGEGDLHCPLCNFTADIKQSLTVHVQNHHASITEQQLNFKIKQQQQQLLQQQQQQQQMLMNENGELVEGEDEEQIQQEEEDEEDMDDEDEDDDNYDGQQVDQYNQQQSMIPRKRSLCTEGSPDESFFQKSVFLQSLALKPNVVYSVSNNDEEEEEDDEDDGGGEENEMDEIGGTSNNNNILPPLLNNNNTSISSTTVTRLSTPKSSPPGRRISINSNEGTSLLNKQLLLGNNPIKKSREKRLFLEELAQKLVASKSEEISSNSTKNSVTISTSTSSTSLLTTTNSTRCQFCRQRCKTSTDLVAHLTVCTEATRASDDESSSNDGEQGACTTTTTNNKNNDLQGDYNNDEGNEKKDCTSENKIFVWNKLPYVGNDEEDEEEDDSMSTTNELHFKNGYSDDLVGFETSPGIGAIHTGKLEELEYEGLDPGKLQLLDCSVITTRKVYSCPQPDCGFWATTASRFHVHSVGHSNMKPFECSQCSYKSNFKWDITKHIKLKALRDPLHANAKIVAHESGERNYRQYDKYLVMMQLKHSADSKLPDCSTLASKRTDVALELSPPTSSVTSPKVSPRGGNSNVPTNLTMPKLTRAPITSRATSPSNSVKSEEGKVRPPPALVPIVGTVSSTHSASSSNGNGSGRTIIVEKRMLSGGHIFSSENPSDPLPESSQGSYGAENDSNGPPNKKMRSSTGENLKKIFWKCKKCPYKHTSKEVVVFHIRQHHKPKRGESVSILSPNFLSTVAQNDDDSQELDASPSSSILQKSSVKETHQYVFNQNDGIYKCKFCPFTVDRLQVMESHSENHFSKPNCHFSCEHCSFSVKTKRELMEHMFLHINKDRGDENSLKITAEETPPKPRGSSVNGTHKKYHCIECPYVTDSKGQFLYHKQFHRPRDCPFKCSECTYMVSHKHLLHQHLRVHGLPAVEDPGSNNNNVEVNEDGSVVDDQPLDLHVQDMTVEAIHPTVLVWRSGRPFRMYRCRMCPRVYTKINDLNEHEMGHGGAISITPAVQNSTDFNEYMNYFGGNGNENETTLNNNNNIVSVESQQKHIISPNSSDNNSTSGKSLHTCEACPARFFYEKELEIHSSFHQAKSEFQCHLCSYSAKQQNPHLLSHMKVHGLDYQMKTQQLLLRYREAPKLSKKKTAAKNLSSTFNISQVNQFFGNCHSSFTTPSPSSTSGGGLVVDSIGGSSSSKKTVIVCQKCPAKFHSKSSYQQHITFHGRDSVFLCRYCDYSVDTLKNLTVHELLHTGPESKMSSLSTMDSMYRTMLNKGKSNISNGGNSNPTFTATAAADDRIDDSAYIGNPTFIYPTYIKNGRVKEKRYKCSKCPSAFEKRDQYKVHMGLHGSDQRYRCAVCDYAVTYYANFIQHLKKHSTQPNIPPELLIAKPLSKQVSKGKNSTAPTLGEGKKTSNISSLVESVTARPTTITSTTNSNTNKNKSHVSSATANKKLWKCPNCPFTSSDKTEAQDHIQHHIPQNSTKTGISPFTCSYCDFTTMKKSSLKEHIRLHFHIPPEQVDSYMYAKDINVYVDGNYDEKIYSEKENYDDVDDNDDDDDENVRSITYIDMKSHLPVPMLQNGNESEEVEEEDDDKPQPIDCTT